MSADHPSETRADEIARRLPADFIWGAATASYQIEGAAKEDGRGESIWDRFSHTPGMVRDGDTGDVACDHYHRWREDIAIMRELGLAAYRFSIAWPRILPDGTGAVNEVGLDWYERLVDGLLEAGIQPWATLYHWDLPQALQDRGGWPARETVDAFVRYADIVARRLGDRIAGWITHNEPWVAGFVGHYQGRHAPGITDLGAAIKASHHILLSHGRAVPVLRAATPNVPVGITLNLNTIRSASSSREDQAAARRDDGYLNRWFLDPIFGRGYPSDLVEAFGGLMPKIPDGDLAEIAVPIDFLGINNYFPNYVRAVERGPGHELGISHLREDELRQRGFEITEMGWPVAPDAFGELLVRVHREYRPPAIYVTENGCAFADTVQDGAVHDDRRTAYLAGHLAALTGAVEAGSPVRGYFVWSLLDNFEWGHGYSKRFGVVHVDFESQQRIVKDSGRWYQGLIRAHSSRA
ncbi:MAG: GH1 family beta-glucosidase [Chloroflexota bacterium]